MTQWKSITRGMQAYKTTLERNRQAVDERNGKVLLVTLISILAVFLMLLAYSFIDPEFTYLQMTFAVVVVVCAALLAVLCGVRSMRGLVMLYIVYALLNAYSCVTSAFISPDFICVTILASLFLPQMLYLDRDWRINTATALSAVVYITVIWRYKEPVLLADEVVNVIGFSLAGGILGYFSRHTQMENIDMKRAMTELAHTDALTGMENRRSLFELLTACEKPDCAAPLRGIAMVDIDDFKRYNDTWGHLMGDEALRQVGRCCAECIRSADVRVFRYGGEEFVIVNQRYSFEEFIGICDAFRLRVAQSQGHIDGRAVPAVTVCVGLAVQEDAADRHYEALLSRADIALYAAKAKGKNTLETYKDGQQAVDAPSSFRRRHK